MNDKQRLNTFLYGLSQLRERIYRLFLEKYIQMRSVIRCFLFLAGTTLVYGQEKEKREPFDFAISPGVACQGQFFGELNLLGGRYVSEMTGNAFPGVRLGVESNFRSKDELIIAPKIGFEISGMVICLRGTALTYFQGPYVQVRLLPEAGISLLGFANLTYGYSFPLNNSDKFDLQGHRFALSFNLNRDVIDDTFMF